MSQQEEASVGFGVSDITVPWLNQVLAGAGYREPGVLGFRVEPVGTGQAAICCRIVLEITKATLELPASLVAKFASDDATSRATAASGGTYLREVQFYRELQSRVSIRTPRCYVAEMRDGGPDFVLLLEDLTPAQQGNQIAGCDESLAAAALGELVGLHAPTWGEDSILKLPWVQSSHPERPKLLMQIYRRGLEPFLERCGDGLDAEEVAFLDRLAARDDYPDFPETKSYCVVHNDFRLDNFLYVEGREADTFRTVDWQTYGAGNPMTDVAYFIGGCLLPPLRAKVERDLVGEYHDQLLAAGVSGYDLEECWSDYRRGAYHGLMYAMAGMVHVSQSERGDELFRTMARRHIRQVLDLGADEALS
jgi:hypothetical protein